MSVRKQIADPCGTYFITFTCARWLPFAHRSVSGKRTKSPERRRCGEKMRGEPHYRQ